MAVNEEMKVLLLGNHQSTKHNNIVTENQNENHLKILHKNLKELYKCNECGKHFGHRHILHLHMQVHRANNKALLTTYPVNLETHDHINNTALPENDKEKNYTMNKDNINHEENKKVQNTLPAKKVVGLTKLRLEDYLRCDACSCIYLDEVDYHKHMKNFHNKDASKKKKRVQRKKECRSCCKNCKCNGNHEHQSPQKQLDDQNYLLHCNIKDRWSKLMEGTQTNVTNHDVPPKIKTEPIDDTDPTLDYSHLLSQVEVRIKTEPVDDFDFDYGNQY